MAIINKGKIFANGEQLTADKLNQVIDNATFTTSAVDNVSTQLAGEAIIVKDSGVTTAKLNNGAVTTAKLNDNAVTTTKIADANVTTTKIADANVTTAKIADANVTFSKLTDVIDDDTMATASATKLATSESIKAYVDASSTTFTPSTYAGEESVTLPNGLIMKMGRTATTSTDTTITFSTAFPNALISVIGLQEETGNSTLTTPTSIGSTRSTSAVNFRHGSASDFINWQAIGY